MKTKDEMIDRYHHLYDKMKENKDPKNMKIFGEAEKWVFKQVVALHPDIAENWLSHLEAICLDNYLSETEGNNISKRTVNQDGSKGFHWTHDAFMKLVNGFDGECNKEPQYNCCALWVTANNIYSDHAKSIAEDMGYKSLSEVPDERIARSFYNKAIERLTDADGGYNIRKYFKNKMYNDSPMQ